MSTVEEQKAVARLTIDRFRKNKHAPISLHQAASAKDRPVPNGICTSKIKMPPPQDTDIRAHLLEAVANLETGNEAFTLPTYAGWEGEWIGRTEISGAGLSKLSEKEKFDLLTRERRTDVTVMYVHGGAYTYGGPVTARPLTIPLNALTGGRCFAVKYRLAPQFQALSLQLDIFMAYLSLLYPPPGAFHSPVSPESLVLAGDSSGAVLVFFVVQLILQLRRQQETMKPTVRWYGQIFEVPVPAGVTALSFAGDHLLCLPSYQKNLEYDMMNDMPPYRSPTGQVDAIWPADPPRGDISCELSAMTSVVYNPCIADSWRGSPPMYLACGEERLADASKLLAQQAVMDGVVVHFEEYALMPHCFVSMVPKLPQAKRCLKAWAEFVVKCTSGKLGESSAVHVQAGRLEERRLNPTKLVDFTRSEARAIMKAKRRTLRVWEGPEQGTKL